MQQLVVSKYTIPAQLTIFGDGHSVTQVQTQIHKRIMLCMIADNNTQQ